MNPVVIGNNVFDGYDYTRVADKFLRHTLVNNDSYVQNSLVELHVYLQTNDIHCVTEAPDLRASTVLSSLGGVIGMSTNICEGNFIQYRDSLKGL